MCARPSCLTNPALAKDADPTKVPDPKAIELARSILVATHADSNFTLAIDAMSPVMVQMLKRDKADIPDAVIQKFLVVFRQKMVSDIPRVLRMEAEIYARHFSVSELTALSQFYKSDVGKKIIEENPKILKETIPLGQAWGRETALRAAEDTVKALRKQGVKI